MFNFRASFHIECRTQEYVYIVDDYDARWPSTTITNDAEAVVSFLLDVGFLSCSQRLYYKDTEGRIDELLHCDGKFKDFKPGHDMEGV